MGSVSPSLICIQSTVEPLSRSCYQIRQALPTINTGPSGTLDSGHFLRAMIQLRNTLDPDCNTSPAEYQFETRLPSLTDWRSLETLMFTQYGERHGRQQKEEALRQRFHQKSEERNDLAKPLHELHVGNRCYIQNQTGPHPKCWDRSGMVVETHGHNSYTLKVDGDWLCYALQSEVFNTSSNQHQLRSSIARGLCDTFGPW